MRNLVEAEVKLVVDDALHEEGSDTDETPPLIFHDLKLKTNSLPGQP